MQWRISLSDLPVFCILMFLNHVDKSSQNRSHDKWEQVTFRYGKWHKLPPYQPKPNEDGYIRANDVCKTDHYHGFLFIKNGNRKAMPIYDSDGNLAGFRTEIPGNMQGYTSLNETIDLPPAEVMPPLLKGLRDSKGILYYTITAYFKHPTLICNPIVPKGVSTSRGLYIQMGFKPDRDYLYIAKETKHLNPLWRRGNCLPQMGTHYFRNLSQHLPCEKLYPVFLMYNKEGHLGGFGWVFQGKPNNFNREEMFYLTPPTYPYLYDTKMLPPCMFYPKFQVFGLHVYFEDPNKLLCPTTMDYKDKSTNDRHRQTSTHPPLGTIKVFEKERQNDNENYNIDAFNNNPSSSTEHFYTYRTNSLVLFVFSLVMIFNRNAH